MLTLLLLAATACGRVSVTDEPASGEPEVGTAYHVTLSCAIPVQLGSTWWEFDEPVVWPERRRTWPWEPISFPYEVPGVILMARRARRNFGRIPTDLGCR
jgi:hypothetical protein